MTQKMIEKDVYLARVYSFPRDSLKKEDNANDSFFLFLLNQFDFFLTPRRTNSGFKSLLHSALETNGTPS